MKKQKEKWYVYTNRPSGFYGSTKWKFRKEFDSYEEAEKYEDKLFKKDEKGTLGVLISKNPNEND